MDFAKAFTFVFDDPDWLKKLLLNALLLLFPVVGLIYVLGWSLEIGRRVATYETPLRLPEIEFGRYLGLGFKAIVLGLVYSLPVLLMALPMMIMPSIAYRTDLGEAGNTLLMLVNFCCSCLMILYGLLIGVLLPAAYMRMAVQGRVGAGLEFGQVLGLVKTAPGAYLITLVGVIVADSAASLVGVLLCGVGIIFTAVYVYAVMGHFYGQAYRVATSKVA